MAADARAGQHDRAVPEPGPGADRHRLVLPHLHADRQVDVFVAVVLVGDVHVVTGPDVVADLDALVADDADALAERAAVADRDDRVAAHVRLCDGMPALMLASGPIVVPAPISMRPSPKIDRRRERDHAARRRTRAKLLRPPVPRPDRAEPHDARPTPRGSTSPAIRSSSSRSIASMLSAQRSTSGRFGHGQRRAPDPRSGCSTTSRRATTCSRTRCGSASTRSRRPGASTATIEFVARQARGLPVGQRARRRPRASRSSSTQGVLAIIGPSISDNALIVAPLCDAAEHPRDQLHRRRAHALAVDVPLPGRLARGGAAGARGPHGRARLRTARRWSSTSRRSAAATPSASRRRAPASASRSPAPRASRRSPRTPTTLLARLRDGEPDVLVYFGLGVVVARGRARAARARLGRAGARQLRADVRLRAPRLARRLRGLGVHRHDRRRQPRARRAARALDRAPAADRSAAPRTTWAACSARRSRGAEHLTRAGIADGLRRVKQLPATSGYDGTLMGFGHWDHAALKGHYLVLRTWRDGRSVQVSPA